MAISASYGTLSFIVPASLAPGSYDLVFFSPNGKLTFISALVVKRTLTVEKTLSKTFLFKAGTSELEMRTQLRRLGKVGSLKLAGGFDRKLHCLVNSSQADIRIRVSGLCDLVDSTFGPSTAVTSVKDSYENDGIWIRIWMKDKFQVEG